MQKIIDEFRGEYDFLSNFYPCEIPDLVLGIPHPTLEHAYQAFKTTDKKQRLMISQCKTPGMAKRAGRGVTLRVGWDNSVKLTIMEFMVRFKFTYYLELRNRLLATGDALLIEGNTWGDTYWGVYNGIGENHLGKILMQVRDELNLIRVKL